MGSQPTKRGYLMLFGNAESREPDRDCRAETDGRRRAERDRRKRRKIERGWETGTRRHHIHILDLQPQSHLHLTSHHLLLCIAPYYI